MSSGRRLSQQQLQALIEAGRGNLVAAETPGSLPWDLVTLTGGRTRFPHTLVKPLADDDLVEIRIRRGQRWAHLTDAGWARLPDDWQRKLGRAA